MFTYNFAVSLSLRSFSSPFKYRFFAPSKQYTTRRIIIIFLSYKYIPVAENYSTASSVVLPYITANDRFVVRMCDGLRKSITSGDRIDPKRALGIGNETDFYREACCFLSFYVIYGFSGAGTANSLFFFFLGNETTCTVTSS